MDKKSKTRPPNVPDVLNGPDAQIIINQLQTLYKQNGQLAASDIAEHLKIPLPDANKVFMVFYSQKK